MSTDVIEIENDLTIKRLDIILRHIKHVQDNCIVLGEKLIGLGEIDLGRGLIKNGQIHDNSKLSGIEWEYLHGDVKETDPIHFKLAATQHVTTNFHHPEFWIDINEMPRIYVAELVCDWSARSSEFGNDIREWTKECATKKYKFTCNGKVYKEIKEFTDLLLEKPFK